MGGGRLDSELKELIEYVEKSSFVEFELERDGFKIKLVKRSAAGGNGPATPIVQTVLPGPATAAASPGEIAAPAAEESPDLHVIKSPIVGTFYRSSAPGTKTFVEMGERVAKGQVLCIVEAMKLMNEIESDCEGEIVEILVSNGQPVEFGEPLFKIRTAA